MSKDKQSEVAEEQAVDPAAVALSAMVAFEDQRYLVQTIAVGDPDANGVRELTFPVNPTKQITMVLAPELQEHIVKKMSPGDEDIAVADLGDIEKLRQEAS